MQFTETFSVNQLATRVKDVGKVYGFDVKINNVENPRKEAEEHYYNPKHTGLLDLGLKPNLLTDDVLAQMIELVIKYKKSIKTEQIFRKVLWA